MGLVNHECVINFLKKEIHMSSWLIHLDAFLAIK